jgi:hypothetical protein
MKDKKDSICRISRVVARQIPEDKWDDFTIELEAQGLYWHMTAKDTLIIESHKSHRSVHIRGIVARLVLKYGGK